MASEALKRNTSLQTVALADTKIGDDGAKALAEVHEQMPVQM